MALVPVAGLLCPGNITAVEPIAGREQVTIFQDYDPKFIHVKEGQTAKQAIQEYGGAKKLIAEHNRLLAENKIMKAVISNHIEPILNQTIYDLFELVRADKQTLSHFKKKVKTAKDINALEIVKVIGQDLDKVEAVEDEEKARSHLTQAFERLQFLIDLMNQQLPVEKRIDYQKLVQAAHAAQIGLPSTFSTTKVMWKGVCITGKVLYVTYSEVLRLLTFLGILPTALVSLAVISVFVL